MRLGIWVLAMLYSGVAWGYDCAYKGPPFFERVDKADIILSGAVLKLFIENGSRTATVRIKDVFKSSEPLKAKEEIKVSFLQTDRYSYDCGKGSGKGLRLDEHRGYLFFLEKRPDSYFTSRDAGTVLDSIAKKNKYSDVIKKYLAGEKKEDLYPLLPKWDRPK